MQESYLDGDFWEDIMGQSPRNLNSRQRRNAKKGRARKAKKLAIKLIPDPDEQYDGLPHAE